MALNVAARRPPHTPHRSPPLTPILIGAVLTLAGVAVVATPRGAGAGTLGSTAVSSGETSYSAAEVQRASLGYRADERADLGLYGADAIFQADQAYRSGERADLGSGVIFRANLDFRAGERGDPGTGS